MLRHGTRRLVNCSSAWQHYSNEEYNPANLYAATKQSFSDLLSFFVEAAGLSVIDLTLSDTYGPNDKRPKLFSALYAAAASETAVAFSPGEQLLDLVYVDDVIDAIMIAANELLGSDLAEFKKYTVRSQQPVRLKDLVATFATITGLSPKITWGDRQYRSREMMTPWRGGSTPLGWKPRISIEDGIRKMHSNHVRHSKD
jgi:nucleoside-diphosphate-sugar epimerase